MYQRGESGERTGNFENIVLLCVIIPRPGMRFLYLFVSAIESDFRVSSFANENLFPLMVRERRIPD
ncbi:hypothetical protein GEV33_006957 [Tenebrio molitor]|uniref:Uncharacterized protein n=1 Tax=Tenebrio molitor TaxID=7067 RepID=A0A8J6HJJ4_TENMO|nr:hypothetical protein GEV33_006957 [Tenebrio molitor]